MIIMGSSQYASAQSTIHEFSLYGGGGFSALCYQLSLGQGYGSIGGDFGVGYTFFNGSWQATETGTVVNSQWGIHTGVGFGLYNAMADLNNLQKPVISSNQIDADKEKFNLHTTLNSYDEVQKALYLNIPVMGVFQKPAGNSLLYGMGGIKLGIPINGKFESKNATLENRAYYTDLENWAEVQKFAGYGTFKNKNFDGDIDLGFCLFFALEGGMKWRIGDNLFLYAGLYFDYGLNNVSKGSYQQFINLPKNNTSDFTTNSVLTSYTDKSKSVMFTEKIHLMAVGVKVRISMER